MLSPVRPIFCKNSAPLIAIIGPKLLHVKYAKNCDATNARAKNEPSSAIDLLIMVEISLVVFILPEENPYAKPGIKNSNIVIGIILSMKGDTASPPVSG